ncbi:hypothetical protein Tco_1151297, partial [Tanacetum coccineum]
CYKRHRLDPNRIFPDIYEVPLNEKEHEIWLEFAEFDKGTAKLDDTNDNYCLQQELGDAYKEGEENHIHDFEFMECKYVKADNAYYFFMTIEAIEEGNLGVYEAKVNVNINDDVRITKIHV